MNILKGTTWAAVVIAGSFVLGACDPNTTAVIVKPNVASLTAHLNAGKKALNDQDATEIAAYSQYDACPDTRVQAALGFAVAKSLGMGAPDASFAGVTVNGDLGSADTFVYGQHTVSNYVWTAGNWSEVAPADGCSA